MIEKGIGMKAILALEDGTVFEGISCGVPGEVTGVVVFNTAVVGFQELLTDPASHGQILICTYPLIGNYGACDADMESDTVQASGLVIRELSAVYSNFRAHGSLTDFIRKHNLVCISEVDTRALAVHLRDHGEMGAILSTTDYNHNSLVEKVKATQVPKAHLLHETTCSQRSTLDPFAGGVQQTVGVLDLGVRRSEVRQLRTSGCRVVLFPAGTPADDIMGCGVDRVFLSGGPSIVLPPEHMVGEVAKFLGTLPVFGTGLGHNMLAAALGCSSIRMRIGHRGVNQPVRNLLTGHVEITVQNHGVVVDRKEVEANSDVAVTHEQINDHTVEGIRSTKYPAFSVQYNLSVVEKEDIHPQLAEFVKV